MSNTSTPNHSERPEPDPVAFYKASQARQLKLDNVLSERYNPNPKPLRPLSKFPNAKALIAKANEMAGFFNSKSERQDEPYRIAGPAIAVRDFIAEFDLYLTHEQCDESTTATLAALHKEYSVFFERFKKIPGLILFYSIIK